MRYPDCVNRNPHTRSNSMYHYKVQKIQGNKVTFVDASRQTHTVNMTNDGSLTLQQQYRYHMDNLFIAVGFNHQYFFYTKLSNERPWATSIDEVVTQ